MIIHDIIGIIVSLALGIMIVGAVTFAVIDITEHRKDPTAKKIMIGGLLTAATTLALAFLLDLLGVI